MRKIKSYKTVIGDVVAHQKTEKILFCQICNALYHLYVLRNATGTVVMQHNVLGGSSFVRVMDQFRIKNILNSSTHHHTSNQ